ncbi:MAG: alpha-mannosyltransferase [Zetaproteobacteria bacterium CG06_land_8_20_14_3_00_59_53]|nr:MAG: alpha-mannosyltransferase [Zetaproteobacteria bacterium CG2_30_59_37]PIO89461.1 MAG: alpha-mannosyltransferase [Zetaproteobacteria bacterium CG23_combo_of_CG06-09_8_20_14_all_59_86]PIQ65486.1 MAG: alpha-mannosyltransferase [Zetaproteobacteria bacterium CG11_big_fil_rev_8_21_14_0_20_59_439]PIU69739.1 MAG: alpha-mannosyltransferase [Zetaproteobacteria bacterium CG06_land_8_20_14_3_00_59_53]PIU96987.1 MAG: alpha-mannosyltransferase [Zetaproteobacteria bacterium CG03_land_8_20_14_0_80_59_51
MKIAIVSDAWHPQINGVVNSILYTRDELEKSGHQVEMFTPQQFRTVPCPTYPSIRLSVMPGGRLTRMLDAYAPDTLHIATEGPLGMAARRWCKKRKLRFTSAYHTQFPQYVSLRIPVPLSWGYGVMRWFHGHSQAIMVPTATVKKELEEQGFGDRVKLWSRGVDTKLFRPQQGVDLGLPRPINMYVGRVAVEKNIGDFLDLDLPGSKLVIGDGPDLEKLKKQHPEVCFVGFKTGEDLAAHIACADVFIFPSRTDTFGLVLLEALACGVPVAAYPVTGPIDVITSKKVGCLDNDLKAAALAALKLKRADCRAYALNYTWEAASRTFESLLVPCNPEAQPATA